MYYLHLSSHRDLSDKKERVIYRFLEILPGFLSLSTLVGAFLLAIFWPTGLFLFLLLFAFYWFLRLLYHTWFLVLGYRKTKENLKKNWLEVLRSLEISQSELQKRGFARVKSWEDIYHLVLLPTYKEPLSLIEETLQAISRSRYPKSKIFVVLSFEERAGSQRKKIAKILQEKYKDKFGELLITFHPKDLPGEIPGHGSNDAWATKEALEKIIRPRGLSLEQVIVSAFDIDTRVFPYYFARLTYLYLTCSDPLHSAFQPVPLYTNHFWSAPALSQTSSFTDTFWQLICQERAGKRVTFSSHAIGLKPLVEVGFKPKNVISDDSRIFFKCYLYYQGRFKVEPLYYPVAMDPNFSSSWFKTLINIYKQQRRWAWGVENIPFVLFGFYKSKKIPWREKLKWSVELLEGFWHWGVASLLLFFFGWLPGLFYPDLSTSPVIFYLAPRTIGTLMRLSMLGILVLVYISSYFVLSLQPFSRKKYLAFLLFWFFLPFKMVFLGSFPALDSQIRWLLGKPLSFWPTPKTRKEEGLTTLSAPAT